MKYLKYLLIAVSMSTFACSGMCSDIKEKAMQYKDKVKPDDLKKAAEKAKNFKK